MVRLDQETDDLAPPKKTVNRQQIRKQEAYMLLTRICADINYMDLGRTVHLPTLVAAVWAGARREPPQLRARRGRLRD
jgi:hypothetical protein